MVCVAVRNLRTLRLHYPLANVVGVEGDSCKIPILATTDFIGNCEGDNPRCKRNR